MADLDHLATVRAALSDVRAWSVECDEPILRTSDGEAADWIASWDHDSIRASADDAIQELVDRGNSVEDAENMVRVISLIPAAPAIAALCDEVERLRATVRRHADARADLFDAYLTATGAPRLRDALRAFFAATEEP